MEVPTLAFDLRGPFGHYKKIFATTSALSYPIPVKTSLYGLLGAVLGLSKADNAYLKTFGQGKCRIAIELRAPVRMQRIPVNLRPKFGSLTVAGKSNPDNRKPTLMEFVRNPHYRIYVQHEDEETYGRLADLLRAGKSTYTPTLGLANMLAQLTWVGEAPAVPVASTGFTRVDSVIPRSRLIKLDTEQAYAAETQLMEVGQYAMEMLPSRDVTVRDDIIFERNGSPVSAKVKDVMSWQCGELSRQIILF
ncbi:MAG: type I-B CRISPR-associated protein Cas5 [Bacteroidetes bacterium]|nr:MAG: type I-B CRISPR-associated protein Cas5 [Bacteroidota bacterium]